MDPRNLLFPSKYLPWKYLHEKEGENNQRQQEKQAIRVRDSFYLLLIQLVMCYEHYKLHIVFLACEHNESAKTAGRKQALNKEKASEHLSDQTPWTRLQTKR